MSFIFGAPASVPTPQITDPEIEKEKRRRQAERRAAGASQTVLTAGPQAPTLGSASTLSGGL